MKMHLKKITVMFVTLFISTLVMAGNPTPGATTAQVKQINANTAAIKAIKAAPAIGDLRDGGVVACIPTTPIKGAVYLITQLQDASMSSVWSNIDTEIGTSAQSLSAGLGNSNAIIAQHGFTEGAAKVCRDTSDGGHNDWYLPAFKEALCLAQNNEIIDKTAKVTPFSNDPYWTSSEYTVVGEENNAFGVNLFTRKPIVLFKNHSALVRCVRGFTP